MEFVKVLLSIQKLSWYSVAYPNWICPQPLYKITNLSDVDTAARVACSFLYEYFYNLLNQQYCTKL